MIYGPRQRWSSSSLSNNGNRQAPLPFCQVGHSVLDLSGFCQRNDTHDNVRKFRPPSLRLRSTARRYKQVQLEKAIPKRSQHYVDSALLPFQRSNVAFQIGNVGASPHHLQNNEMHRRPFSLSMFRKEMRRGQGSVRGPVEERPNASLRLPESTLQRRQARDRQIPAPLRDKHLPLLSPDRQRN